MLSFGRHEEWGCSNSQETVYEDEVTSTDMEHIFVEVVGAAIALPSTADGCKRETGFL